MRSVRSGAAATPTRTRCSAPAIAARSNLPPRTGLTSIAFPAISTGIYGFPADRAARIATGTVVSELSAKPLGITRVVLCCFDAQSAQCYVEALAEMGLG